MNNGNPSAGLTAAPAKQHQALARMAEPIPDGRRRAVVIGGSMAGMLAAAAVADHFDEVIVLERDTLPDGPALRKATPHTAHAHAMLARGAIDIEGLLPGITQEWREAGACLGDLGTDVSFHAAGHRHQRVTAGIQSVSASRGLLEAEVRRRVLATRCVHALPGVEVTHLRHAGSRITGVEARSLVHFAGAESGLPAPAVALPAHLVIDAGGRGSCLPRWLRELGCGTVPEDRVDVDMRYATAYFRRHPGQAGSLRAAICSASAVDPRPGVLLMQEDNRWVVTLGGYGAADAPPLDAAGFARRAADMASAELREVVARGEFLCEPFGYRYPGSVRRRYERLHGLPSGILPLGDTLCSFNPVYGQGMSVAAAQAALLKKVLNTGTPRLTHDYLKGAQVLLNTPWSTAVGADLALPGVRGRRPQSVKLINAYVSKVHAAAAVDPEVALAFRRVMHLLATPRSLMTPSMLWKVWRATRPGRIPRPVPPGTPAGAGQTGSSQRTSTGDAALD